MRAATRIASLGPQRAILRNSIRERLGKRSTTASCTFLRLPSRTAPGTTLTVTCPHVLPDRRRFGFGNAFGRSRIPSGHAAIMLKSRARERWARRSWSPWKTAAKSKTRLRLRMHTHMAPGLSDVMTTSASSMRSLRTTPKVQNVNGFWRRRLRCPRCRREQCRSSRLKYRPTRANAKVCAQGYSSSQINKGGKQHDQQNYSWCSINRSAAVGAHGFSPDMAVQNGPYHRAPATGRDYGSPGTAAGKEIYRPPGAIVRRRQAGWRQRNDRDGGGSALAGGRLHVPVFFRSTFGRHHAVWIEIQIRYVEGSGPGHLDVIRSTRARLASQRSREIRQRACCTFEAK